MMPDEVEYVDGLGTFQRGAGNRHQRVDRNALGWRREIAEHLEHPKPIVGVFSHPENATATDRHAGVLDVLDGVEPILEGVGRDDVPVVLGRGVDVVVVGGHAGLAEFLRLDLAELAEGHAHLHAKFPDVADDVEDLLEPAGAIADALPGRAHAETGGTVFAGRPAHFP